MTKKRLPRASTKPRSRVKAVEVLQPSELRPLARRCEFPVVGLGASAGGLEALVGFFENLPPSTPMSFVVIQHLDPTQKGMMAELLQRATTMKVIQATDGVKIQPRRVYVIPPNSDLSLYDGRLHLLAPSAPRGMRMPIDFFFRSLAEDQKEGSVGIVLSGMGSDGTLGLQAIKEAAGLTLVQDPATAKFDSMPRSAVEAGLADFTANVEELPRKLISYERHLPKLPGLSGAGDERVRVNLRKVLLVLRAGTGHDFGLYRQSTLNRRVHRRMGIHQLSNVGHYVRYLRENPQEVTLLFKELLIGVTSFFRDAVSWQALVKKGLPNLISAIPDGGTFRAWVAGCSTGEEAYTLAMVLVEAVERLRPGKAVSIQIYATDLDKDAIEKARRGLFPGSIVADVSPGRLSRFFVKEGRGYRVNKETRNMIVFAPQNLILDPPFTKLDLLCCRNLLIYLTPELQKKIFPLFHYSLRPGGVLFLGSAESLGNGPNLFQTLLAKERIFLRREASLPSGRLEFPAMFPTGHRAASSVTHSPRTSSLGLQAVAERLLQTKFAPPAVLANAEGDIVFVSGRTGKYLEAASGKANWNLLVMAREELRYELTSAWQKLRRKKSPVSVHGIRASGDGEDVTLGFELQLLEEPKELQGMILVVFSSAVAPAATMAPVSGSNKGGRPSTTKGIEQELKHAREEIQAGREEMQTSQEELMSMNEELQSTNEELQSANEELTTSKEEMQSLNEELQTVNAELQAKLDELSGANDDMKNLLNSTDIATLFLDHELKIRRYTLQAKAIIKLIPGDIGRPITDMASDLIYPSLIRDAHTVLKSMKFIERTIPATGDRWYNVRIMPYKTEGNAADGIVITFAEVTAAKQMEAELRETNEKLATRSHAQDRSLKLANRRLASRGQVERKQPGIGKVSS